MCFSLKNHIIRCFLTGNGPDFVGITVLRCPLLSCLLVDASGGFSGSILVGVCGFSVVCDVWEGQFGVSIDGGTTCRDLGVVFSL